MINRILLGIIVVMMVVLGACNDKKEADPGESSKEEAQNSDPAESEAPEGYGRVKMVKDEEMVALEMSMTTPKQLPIDFPLSLPEVDNNLIASERYLWPDGEITYYIRFEAPMEFDDIVEFYEEKLTGMGLTASRETYDPTSLAILTAGEITVKVEDVYEPEYFTVIIETVKK